MTPRCVKIEPLLLPESLPDCNLVTLRSCWGSRRRRRAAPSQTETPPDVKSFSRLGAFLSLGLCWLQKMSPSDSLSTQNDFTSTPRQTRVKKMPRVTLKTKKKKKICSKPRFYGGRFLFAVDVKIDLTSIPTLPSVRDFKPANV